MPRSGRKNSTTALLPIRGLTCRTTEGDLFEEVPIFPLIYSLKLGIDGFILFIMRPLGPGHSATVMMLRPAIGTGVTTAARTAAPARAFVKPTSPRKVDHHALLVLSSLATYVQATHSVMRHQSKSWLRNLTDKEPVVVFACLVGTFGLLLPVTVVPVRRAMGFDTSQYDGVGGH